LVSTYNIRSQLLSLHPLFFSLSKLLRNSLGVAKRFITSVTVNECAKLIRKR
jgi:hypothetical protein